jgi:hypothetical protein
LGEARKDCGYPNPSQDDPTQPRLGDWKIRQDLIICRRWCKGLIQRDPGFVFLLVIVLAMDLLLSGPAGLASAKIQFMKEHDSEALLHGWANVSLLGSTPLIKTANAPHAQQTQRQLPPSYSQDEVQGAKLA